MSWKTLAHPLENERGGSLIVTMMVMAFLATLGTALVYNSVSDRQISSYERDSVEALAAAETGLAMAKRMIQDLTAPIEDYDSDGYPDFTFSETLPWGGDYTLRAEAGEIKDITGFGAYRAQGYTVVVEGRSEGAVRRVRAQLVHDTFLKYARFVETTGNGYACSANIQGEVYVGGDLSIPTCAVADRVTFLEYVAATGDIPNASEGVFMRGYVTDARPIDLENSADFDELRDRSQGLAADNSCDRVGSVGMYVNLGGGSDPIGVGGTGGILELHKFDFYDLTTAPPDTCVLYDGAPVTNVVTGLPMRRDEFNGLIFWEGDAHVQGVADGISARSLLVVASDDVYADSSITMGHTGFDPGTRLPNGSGDPVNMGLVAFDDFRLGPVPRVANIDAGIMAVNGNWGAASTSASSHPALSGAYDLNQDGVIENPNPEGWNENPITSSVWCLNMNGPLITSERGGAAPWTWYSGPGPTRRYNYDLDITEFPPPCFPVPLNLWLDVTWTEVFDVASALEDHLP